MRRTTERRGGVHAVLLFLAAAAVFALTAGIAGCGDGGPPGSDELRAAPPPDAGPRLAMGAQQADTITLLATWNPVEFRGDTIREYVREVGYDDGSWEAQDTVQAVGSETLDVPVTAAEGETVIGFYCLRSLRRAADGGPVVAPEDDAEMRRCTGWQYTAPLDFPPPPDSLDVSPEQAVAIDSMRILPDSVHFVYLTDAGPDSTTEIHRAYFDEWPVLERTIRVDTIPTASIHMAALLLKDGEIVGCDGDCSQFPLSAAGWDDGVPYYVSGRPGYEDEWRVRRLPWFRQLAAMDFDELPDEGFRTMRPSDEG